MRYMRSKHIRTLVCILAALPVMLLVPGCVNDYDDCSGTERGDSVKLRFTIVTRTPMDDEAGHTRAADIAGDQIGSPSENYLNLAGRDIRFLLFDGERKLLRDFTPDIDVAPAVGDNGRYISYTVRATIPEPYFERVSEEDTDFYIMVIANGRPHSLNPFGLTVGSTTIEQVADQLTTFTVKTYIVDPETYGRFGWEPSQPGQADGQYIPMAGLQHFTIMKGALDANGLEGFVELSPADGSKNINMLRALAKIEVIDRIGITGNFADAPQPRIYVEKAELFGYCPTGTILPAYGQWNRNGVLETQQVDLPTMASPMRYIPPSADIDAPNWNSVIDLHEDYYAQNERADGCPVFSVYVTEYSLAAIGSQLPPYIRVTVYNPNSPDEESKFYRVSLAYYKDGKVDSDIPFLLRNHIYRYEITSVRSASPDTRSALGSLGNSAEESLGVTVEECAWSH